MLTLATLAKILVNHGIPSNCPDLAVWLESAVFVGPDGKPRVYRTETYNWLGY